MFESEDSNHKKCLIDFYGSKLLFNIEYWRRELKNLSNMLNSGRVKFSGSYHLLGSMYKNLFLPSYSVSVKSPKSTISRRDIFSTTIREPHWKELVSTSDWLSSVYVNIYIYSMCVWNGEIGELQSVLTGGILDWYERRRLIEDISKIVHESFSISGDRINVYSREGVLIFSDSIYGILDVGLERVSTVIMHGIDSRVTYLMDTLFPLSYKSRHDYPVANDSFFSVSSTSILKIMIISEFIHKNPDLLSLDIEEKEYIKDNFIEILQSEKDFSEVWSRYKESISSIDKILLSREWSDQLNGARYRNMRCHTRSTHDSILMKYNTMSIKYDSDISDVVNYDLVTTLFTETRDFLMYARMEKLFEESSEGKSIHSNYTESAFYPIVELSNNLTNSMEICLKELASIRRLLYRNRNGIGRYYEEESILSDSSDSILSAEVIENISHESYTDGKK